MILYSILKHLIMEKKSLTAIAVFAACLSLSLFSCQNRVVENTETDVNYVLDDFARIDLNLSEAVQAYVSQEKFNKPL